MNHQTTALQAVENNENIPAKLAVAERALAEATDDWQRIEIRDYAKAVALAAEILKHKHIQVQAANLVQDAERAIAKANQPNITGRPKKVVIWNNDLFKNRTCYLTKQSASDTAGT